MSNQFRDVWSNETVFDYDPHEYPKTGLSRGEYAVVQSTQLSDESMAMAQTLNNSSRLCQRAVTSLQLDRDDSKGTVKLSSSHGNHAETIPVSSQLSSVLVPNYSSHLQSSGRQEYIPPVVIPHLKSGHKMTSSLTPLANLGEDRKDHNIPADDLSTIRQYWMDSVPTEDLLSTVNQLIYGSSSENRVSSQSPVGPRKQEEFEQNTENSSKLSQIPASPPIGSTVEALKASSTQSRRDLTTSLCENKHRELHEALEDINISTYPKENIETSTNLDINSKYFGRKKLSESPTRYSALITGLETMEITHDIPTPGLTNFSSLSRPRPPSVFARESSLQSAILPENAGKNTHPSIAFGRRVRPVREEILSKEFHPRAIRIAHPPQRSTRRTVSASLERKLLESSSFATIPSNRKNAKAPAPSRQLQSATLSSRLKQTQRRDPLPRPVLQSTSKSNFITRDSEVKTRLRTSSSRSLSRRVDRSEYTIDEPRTEVLYRKGREPTKYHVVPYTAPRYSLEEGVKSDVNTSPTHIPSRSRSRSSAAWEIKFDPVEPLSYRSDGNVMLKSHHTPQEHAAEAERTRKKAFDQARLANEELSLLASESLSFILPELPQVTTDGLMEFGPDSVITLEMYPRTRSTNEHWRLTEMEKLKERKEKVKAEMKIEKRNDFAFVSAKPDVFSPESKPTKIISIPSPDGSILRSPEMLVPQDSAKNVMVHEISYRRHSSSLDVIEGDSNRNEKKHSPIWQRFAPVKNRPYREPLSAFVTTSKGNTEKKDKEREDVALFNPEYQDQPLPRQTTLDSNNNAMYSSGSIPSHGFKPSLSRDLRVSDEQNRGIYGDGNATSSLGENASLGTLTMSPTTVSLPSSEVLLSRAKKQAARMFSPEAKAALARLPPPPPPPPVRSASSKLASSMPVERVLLAEIENEDDDESENENEKRDQITADERYQHQYYRHQSSRSERDLSGKDLHHFNPLVSPIRFPLTPVFSRSTTIEGPKKKERLDTVDKALGKVRQSESLSGRKLGSLEDRRIHHIHALRRSYEIAGLTPPDEKV